MTPRQSFAIFTITGFDVRGCNLTVEAASELIGKSKKGFDISQTVADLPGAVFKREVKAKKDWQSVYNEALSAALKAGRECKPTPMIVGSPSTPFGNDVDPTKKTYFVPDGVCGFSSVIISDGRSSFAKWLRDNKLGGRQAYYGGVYCDYNDREFGQSYERKCAATGAFVEVLGKYGVKARSESRLD